MLRKIMFLALAILHSLGSMLCLTVTTDNMRAGHMHVTEHDVQLALQAVHRTDADAARRLGMIERVIWQTFQALPKNVQGRLGPNGVRYIVHKYFSKEHGWLVKGLESRGITHNVGKLHEASVLQDKAPTVVAALMYGQTSELGLSLSDIVAIIAVLEQFIFSESAQVLAAAYALNRLSIYEAVDEDSLRMVLASYLILFGQGEFADFTNVTLHQEEMEIAASTGVLEDMIEFVGDTVGNYNFMRRFRALSLRQYSYEAVSEIVLEVSKNYGKWQNTDCLQMKAALIEFDTDQSGRVPLGKFFNQPEGATYHFTESVDYLRQIGALEETIGVAPRVLITNYLAGPSNCIATSSYYSVCCLSECEALMTDLEEKVQAPAAAPEHLLTLVGNISSSTVDAPWVVSDALATKLRIVAERNGGMIPLHGRLFTQWLHYAFPYECPLPSAHGSAGELTADYWLREDRPVSATESEMEMHIKAAANAVSSVIYTTLSEWSDEEVLLLDEQSLSSQITWLAGIRYVAQVTAIILALHAAVKAGQTATRTLSGADGKRGKLALPFHY